MYAAATRAGVKKRVTCHAFRHSFATHVLEAGYDVRQVQTLLGHASLRTTMVYVHVMNKPAVAVQSPLDRLGCRAQLGRGGTAGIDAVLVASARSQSRHPRFNLTRAETYRTIHPDQRMNHSAASSSASSQHHQPQRLMAWMESLADPTRLRLLRLLERHELGVAELCDVLQMPQSTVSRHLKVLGDQKWVRGRRQGTNHLYRTILDELEAGARRLWVLAREQTDAWPAVKQDRLRLDRLLAEKQGDSQAFFAGAAGEWDRFRRELYGTHFSDAAMLALLPGDYVVADLGCGTGQVMAQLAPFVKQVIGVDKSPAMLKAARKRLGERKNVDLRKGDLSAVPIDDGTCDAAMLILALTYVADPAAVLAEMARVLKPDGGRAVIVDLLPHDREDFRRQLGQTRLGFDAKELEQLLADAGFAHATVRPLPPEPNAKGPALFLATATR